jgi:flagellar hook-basal body complex protein FliE
MKLTEITNSLTGLDNSRLASLIGIDTSSAQNQQSNDKGSFSDILKNSLTEVNQSQINAYDAMSDIATGKVENLQEAVQKIEEAELSLKLGLEIKNKALVHISKLCKCKFNKNFKKQKR